MLIDIITALVVGFAVGSSAQLEWMRYQTRRAKRYRQSEDYKKRIRPYLMMELIQMRAKDVRED